MPEGRGWLPRLRHRSVRFRLLVIALVPIVVLMPLFIAFMMERWITRTEQILLGRVTSDLVVAHQYLSHLVDNTGQNIALLGQAADIPQGAERATWIEDQRENIGLDFLWVDDGNTAPFDSPLFDAARNGLSASGLEVLSHDELMRISPQLADRAKISLTGADGRTQEDRGLVILAARSWPMPDGSHRLTAGGILLNHNAKFIDTISALVYPANDPTAAERVADHLDRGVISLFLDDVRISTTALGAGGQRAIGTVATNAVRDKVLGQGKTWNDRAFVVNDWFLSAYEPIRDDMGKRVGMLYAGVPEAPYRDARWQSWIIIGAVFLVLCIFSVPLFLHWVGGVFRPIEAMGRTITNVDSGNMRARTGTVSGAPEITRLSHRLDQLLNRIQAREQDLKDLNSDLNQRVDDRTADLTRSNLALEAASRQLVLSEKLATIGEVTAGVAHEINNPLAVIQGNLEVLRMILDETGADATPEIALIDAQIQRISALVGQLLQFSKPEEFADTQRVTLPGPALDGVRPLVQHMLGRSGVDLHSDLQSNRHLRLNLHELQQIFVNLIANAVQAMPHGGTITIKATDEDHDGQSGVLFEVADTGQGMDAATLGQIFDPFFTTRGQAGTGLGLPICQAIIARQGGTIRAESRKGEGSQFFIWLPAVNMSS